MSSSLPTNALLVMTLSTVLGKSAKDIMFLSLSFPLTWLTKISSKNTKLRTLELPSASLKEESRLKDPTVPPSEFSKTSLNISALID